MDDDDLARSLRAWRDRLTPAAAGLAPGSARRAPGLRREELARLAGLSPDYLARLEQGRARHPSSAVVAALARALRLGDGERDHLYRLAGQVPPAPGRISRHLTPGVQRMLDRLEDLPVAVFDACWELIARNALAEALLGELGDGPGRGRNIAWRHFTRAPSAVVRDARHDAEFEVELVADLHAALGRYPADPDLRSLVDDLLDASPRFGELWEARPAYSRVSTRKTFVHPEVGSITLDCDVLRVEGSDVRLVIYTPEPGSPDADALALLAVVGLQRVGIPG
jgi:transcriptional regulator with XRE-family HTH domain